MMLRCLGRGFNTRAVTIAAILTVLVLSHAIVFGETAAAQSTFDAAAHFRGRTITLLVPWGAGGSVDLTARSMQRFLEQNIPGNPSVIVQNSPAGGGIPATHEFFFRAEPNGYTVLVQTPSVVTSQMMPDLSYAEYDLGKMIALAAVGEGNIKYASTARISSLSDVVASQNTLFVGIRGAASSTTIDTLYSLSLLNRNFRAITYPGGTAEARARVFAGEADIFAEYAQNYFESIQGEVERGTVVPLYQTGLLRDGQIIRDPRAASIPTLDELYEDAVGVPLSEAELNNLKVIAGFHSVSRVFLAAPNTPEPIVQVLADAIARTFADPQWRQATALEGREFSVYDARETAELIDLLLRVPDSFLEEYRALLEEVM